MSWATDARAEKRVALVIGNSAYKETSALANPANDAADIAEVLRGHKFEVVEASDLDMMGMRHAIDRFIRQLVGADVGILFYAGHGLQVNGQNYLVPTDAKLDSATSLAFEVIRLDDLQRLMEAQSKINLIFLDACRDNPLARNLARAMKSGARALNMSRGLAAVESSSGTLISFSTQPGNVALDGTGRNSPYAGAFVKRARDSREDLSTILIRVRKDVMDETRGRQTPWEHSALLAKFYFAPPEPPKPAPPPGPTFQEQAELAFWQTVRDSRDAAMIQSYVDQFPKGIFVPLARTLIDRTAREQEQERLVREREEELKAARVQREAAAARDAETKRKLVEADRAEVLQQAREEARKAQAALQQAEARRVAAEASAAEARQAAESARREREAIAKQAAVPPQSIAALPASSSAPEVSSTTAEQTQLVRQIQTELKRVGCDPGPVDGIWGTKAKGALSRFAAEAKVAVDADTPLPHALDLLRARTTLACAPECDLGEVMRGGRCVAIAKATPPAGTPTTTRSATADKPVPEAARREPPSGTVAYGEKVLVDDGTCGPGRIKEVTGGNNKLGINRQRRCISR